jgi:transposase-like protein
MRVVFPRYSEERKAAVLKKPIPPQNRSIVSVAAEEGISDVTLYSWLEQCRRQEMHVPGNRNTGEEWPPKLSWPL